MANTENKQPTNEMSTEDLEKATAPDSTKTDTTTATPATTTTETPAATEAPATATPPAAPAAPAPQAPVVKSPIASTLPKPQHQPKQFHPTVKPAATVTSTAAPAPAEGPVDVKAVITAAQAEATTTGKILLQNLLDYMDVMAPRKPVSVEVGARHQVALYRAITRMINGLEDDFSLVFTAFLRVFGSQAAGVFSETHVFRFMESISLPQDDIKAFQRLLNLFINTADPKGRAQGLKMTDFNKTLEYGITDEGRARVLTYFNK